jgi:hypothetical protein
MTKIFLTLILITIPLSGLAIEPGEVPGSGDFGIEGVNVESAGKLLDILGKVVRYVYYAFFIIAVLFIVLAAYDYLTKSGEPEKIKEVHKKLLYAAIAIVVALLAVGAEAIIREFLGGRGGTGGGTIAPQDIPRGGGLPGDMYPYGDIYSNQETIGI